MIIPVYNEERHLKACLDAVAAQTRKPKEVIVVDNNCTDGTIAIAKSYDFVTIINEHDQGLIAARNTGFKAAKGDIHGRIDADSILDPDWCERVIRQFERDTTVSAVTGIGRTPLLPALPRLTSTFMSRVYFLYIEADYEMPVLWGANMAIRRSAWKKIRNHVCLLDRAVHEDQDISLHLHEHGLVTKRDNKLRITSYDESLSNISKGLYYDALRARTKQAHRELLRRSFSLKRLPGLMIGNVVRIYFYIVGLTVVPIMRKLGYEQID